MKKLVLLLLFVPLVSFGQKTYYGYKSRESTKEVQSLQIKCNGYTFVIYSDNTPPEFSFNAGDDIKYEFGKVSKIGDIEIRYLSGKVSKIGNVEIRYQSGKILQVGDMSLKYGYGGKLTGSSGEIGCDW